jgi:rhodanese-related sulfurtransferase
MNLPSFALLKQYQPLQALADERLRELAEVSRIVELAPGAEVAMAGQLVYLLRGEVLLRLADGSSSVLLGGSDASHWPLAHHQPLAASAITAVEVLCVDDDLVDVMLAWDQMADATESATSGAANVSAARLGALASLPPAHLEALVKRFVAQPVKRGEVIMREGDSGEHYYLIESGRAEVARQIGGIRLLLAELKAGDAFGEEALLAGARRNATVTMKTDGVLLRLDKKDFLELLREPLLKSIARPEAERLVAAGQAQWLDVRFSSDYRFDRLPGAINMPLGELRNAFEVLSRERIYVVYCRTGRLSAAAAFLLAQRGFHAYWLAGGLRGEQGVDLAGGGA